MTREEREKEIVKAAEKMLDGNPNYMSTRELAFVLGAHWADEHPRWISVEDEMPKGESEYDEFSEIVLATDGKDVYESRYHIEYNTWYTRNMFVFNEVSHWMPLPQPPKKGGEE